MEIIWPAMLEFFFLKKKRRRRYDGRRTTRRLSKFLKSSMVGDGPPASRSHATSGVVWQICFRHIFFQKIIRGI
jgi:hypothetical protein